MTEPLFTLELGPEWAEAIEHLVTVRDWIRFAVTAMEEADCTYGQGCAEPLCEARWLVGRALQLPLDALDAFLDARLLPQERERLAQLLASRIEEKIPTAYLLNEAWLQGRAFYVDERVIIPRSFLAELLRPEAIAEWLVDEHHTPIGVEKVSRVLELCTGNGSLAILAAQALPHAEIVATDLSPEALEVAAINIESYGLSDRITLRQGDLYAALTEEDRRTPFDLILANPPYVTAAALEQLPDEFRHEPRLALAAGDDGMELVQRIVEEAPRYLRAGGKLLVEVGHNRREAEAALAQLALPAPQWLATATHSSPVLLLTAPW